MAIVRESKTKSCRSRAKKLDLKPYFKSGTAFTLYKEDCRKVLPKLKEESVDMIFADPPYFLSNGGITCQSGRMVSVNKGKWDKSGTLEENHEFNRTWLEACRRVMKPNATIWVSGTAHIIFSVGFAMQQLGFRILNDIAWVKTNPPPNLGCRCFTHSCEWILWASKSKKSKHVFHYQKMKKEAGGKQMKNVWTFNAPPRQEKTFGKHPTQKPLPLLDRIIRASTNEGDLVLDPFNGSGTSGIAAYRLKRNYVGIEIEKMYLNLTVKRFRHELANPSLFD